MKRMLSPVDELETWLGRLDYSRQFQASSSKLQALAACGL
jgi:hypothetical protein